MRRYFSLFSALLKQSSGSGALQLVLIALSLAISATTALRFSHQQIQYSIAQQSAQLLAADLAISSSRPIYPQWQEHAHKAGLISSQIVMFNSMAMANDEFILVNVKAIEQNFPLRGELLISTDSAPSQTQQQTQRLENGQIWLSPILFELLQVQQGDEVQIADATFTVSGRIDKDTNQQTGFGGFSPTVIIRADEVKRTNAIQLGSRQDNRLLLSGEPRQLEAFLTSHEETLRSYEPGGSAANLQSGSLRLLKSSEGISQLVEPMQQLHSFMQLANLLTLLLCGIAIALSAHRYVEQNQDHVAMLRCLGASRTQLLGSFMALLALVAVIATLIGMILGVFFGYTLLKLVVLLLPQIELQFALRDLINGPLPIAVLTCTLMLAGFIMPAIWQLSSLPPTNVLRPAEGAIVSWRLLASTAIISLLIFSMNISTDILLGIAVMFGIFAMALLFYLFICAVLLTTKRSFTKAEQWLRQPAKTGLQITALALGLSLFTVLFLLRGDLLERWKEQLPEGTPNHFVMSLPPYEREGFEQLLKERQWSADPLYSFVRGRLVAHNGQSFSDETIERSNTLRRDLNLTQSGVFPDNNLFVAGKAEFTGPNQVSVEEENAIELGLKLGDTLQFELPDGTIEVEVVSFRQVQWESFSPNFFFVFSPGTMAQDNASYLGSFYIPPADKSQLGELIRHYPTTVFIDVDAVLTQVMGIVQMIAKVISYLAILVMVAGLLVLLASLNLLMDERRTEVALLRVIGLSQRKIQRYLSLEMAFIGAAAGFVAILFAEIIAAIAAYYLNLSWQAHGFYWLLLPLCMAFICALVGRYRLRRLWLQAPLQSLRTMD
ncbi:MAG: ABC transporter permease [Alcaligenaceae bacterium]|nr:ABC transporter permease [Alcaligenaceae bacterium]